MPTQTKLIYPYDVTNVTELRQAWEVAYGEMGVYSLVGAMFAHLEQGTINELYNIALEKVREDMEKAGQL